MLDVVPKRKPVFWFSFRDDRRRKWCVCFVVFGMVPDIGKNDDGEEDEGAIDFARRRIFINAKKPKATWGTTALHEMGHVALADTGLAYKETFIECHAVHQLPILRSLGFGFPKPPPAVLSLRRAP